MTTIEESKSERRKRMQREAKARWRADHPEEQKQLRRRSYEKNRARLLIEKRELYKKQSESICARMRRYAKQNRSKINERETMRRQRNPNVKLRHSIGGRIRYAIKEQRGTKAKRTIDLIGCSIEKLRKHIESQFKPGMTWENHGTDGWHIDHIKPCASFNLLDPEEQRKCFHWKNMQPLWAAENFSKGAR